MTSSMRLRNSGLKCWRSASISCRRTPSSSVVSPRMRALGDEVAADVRRHDDDRVLEVHRPALAVRQPAVVEQLQHDVQHFGMRLFDLVEQHDGVRPPPHGFGELPGLLVADVSRRRADQPRHRVLLLVLRHVDADHRLLVVEQELGERARELGLADAGRAEEDEAAERPVRILQAGAGAADRVRHRGHRVVLADDALVQPLLHVDELLDLAFHQPADTGMCVQRDDDLGDVFLVDLLLEHARLAGVAPRRACSCSRICRSSSGMRPYCSSDAFA